ncbi:DUF3667 domain-containing protein [uncultured Winogradskyella sp.]|uniref:DUF3667 domain-containing protein n=1 Tax=uncultured Winogradskyella sp. TaxID=395353 RepID=UPI00260E4C35|nr:DUF3667 domain-containing protein [uncultured Winogradskyella sp.]
MNCRNCNKTLNNTQNYCDECGAKIIQNRLTPKVLANQVNEQFISIDNKFLQTFIDLFKKPEAVIDGYVKGTRKKYIDALQYFAISLTFAAVQVFLMTTFFKEALEFDSEFFNKIANAPGNENNPFLNSDFESTSKYQGLIYIFTLPFSAFSTWLAYYIVGDKRYNFTEHLVLNIYFSAQTIIIIAIISIVFLLFDINYILASFILTPPMFFYLAFVLHRVFKDRFWDSFAKFILTMVIYVATFSGVGILAAVVGLIIGLS